MSDKKPQGMEGQELTGKGHILAEGEVTGHTHTLHRTDVFEDGGGTRHFDVPAEGDVLTHEEHGKIGIEEGQYSSAPVREYNHEEQEVEQVRD